VAQLHHLPSHGLQDLSPIQRVHQDGANPTAALCSAAVQPSPCCLPRRRSSFIHRSGDRNGAYRFLFCSNWCESSIRFVWGVLPLDSNLDSSHLVKLSFVSHLMSDMCLTKSIMYDIC
jgi:hypothetical protein